MSSSRPAPHSVLPPPPSDEADAAAAIAPFVGMSPDERLRAQAALVRSLLAFAAGRRVLRDDDFDPLWPHWKDPCFARRSG